MSYTEGNWFVGKAAYPGGPLYVCHGGQTLAIVYPVSAGAQKGNATLMSAAPELLSLALVVAGLSVNDWTPEQVKEMAKAAIAKARGESK